MSTKRYIGGAFAANDSKRFYSSSGDWESYFPLTIGGLQRNDFETGVDALAACLKQINAYGTYPVFVPQHYCAQTLRRLILKCPQISIYRYAHLAEIPDTLACVLWNHFNGYAPPPQLLFANQNWLVIEDYVQAAFSLNNPKGVAAFTSLRKWAELDVAFLYIATLNIVTAEVSSEYFKTKKQAERDKAIWLDTGNDALEKKFLTGFHHAENAFNTESIHQANATQILKMKAISWTGVIEQRRKNLQVLREKLPTLLYGTLDTQALFCMLYLQNRDDVRRTLADKGIFAPVHWLDSNDSQLSGSLLSLPIDQRYSREDMERILDTLNDVIDHKML